MWTEAVGMVERARIPTSDNAALAALAALPSLSRGADLVSSVDVLPTGLPPLDAFLGGLPLRHTHLLAGARGAGTTTLLHGLLAAITRAHPVLLLDPHARFFPPGAAAAGVHLPHLLHVPTGDLRKVVQAIGFALRGDGACPLIVWDAGLLPPTHHLDRLLPDVRAGRCALLLVAEGMPPAAPGITGATFIARHERWEHGRGCRPECVGRTVMVAVTDRRRHRTATMPLSFRYPHPLPSLLRAARKGVVGDAGTTGGGPLAAGLLPASRRAG
jgi:hypothetical protein